MAEFKVRTGLGNSTREMVVRVQANNAKDAMRMAECQTGGKAKGQAQTDSRR